jgi:hypothetical protein
MCNRHLDLYEQSCSRVRVLDKHVFVGLMDQLMSAKAKVELKMCVGHYHSEICQDLTRVWRGLAQLIDYDFTVCEKLVNNK